MNASPKVIGEVRVYYTNSDWSDYDGHWCCVYDTQDFEEVFKRVDGSSWKSPCGPVIKYRIVRK